ncbi:XRE family transcriptional regulator [Escherichia coli]|uniref:XRE family transcriptional regulator n=3 Tax=Enterobacteriaceae TaxID=543 RepID=UPI002FBEC25E
MTVAPLVLPFHQRKLTNNGFNMRLINNYTPPKSQDLHQFKEMLGYTGNQMAELAGISSDSQWRKYINKENNRSMSLHILFFMAAQTSLGSNEINTILNKMREIGATFDS